MKNIIKLVTSIVLGFIDFPRNKHYQAIVKSKKTMISSDKKATNTRAWLMSDVISAMVKTYKNGDIEIIPDFFEALSNELSKLETSTIVDTNSSQE